MKTLSGRSALITGGLTGQGFVIAQALAANGTNVAVGSNIGASKGRSGDAEAKSKMLNVRIGSKAA